MDKLFEPSNEMGVIVRFVQMCDAKGVQLVSIRANFPDAVVLVSGVEYRVEFEMLSSNFVAHQHDPRECDLIICWEHDWSDCPLTVWELKDWTSTSVSICNPKDAEICWLKMQVSLLQREVKALKREREKVDFDDLPEPSFPSDWRKLSDEQRQLLAQMPIHQIQALARLSESGARLWKQRLSVNGHIQEN